jgi:hypothetical protein
MKKIIDFHRTLEEILQSVKFTAVKNWSAGALAFVYSAGFGFVGNWPPVADIPVDG